LTVTEKSHECTSDKAIGIDLAMKRAHRAVAMMTCTATVLRFGFSERQCTMTPRSSSLSSYPDTIDRRRLLRRLAAAGFSTAAIASILRDSTFAQDATPEADETLAELGKDTRLIRRGSTTFETPVDLFDSFLTENDRFFIRSNGPVSVDIPADEWRLAVTGLVDTPLDLGLSDLQDMPSRTITAFLECSGNSRGRFPHDPEQTEGTQWGNGAIGNAEWTGVSLNEILRMAGVQQGAVDVVSQGGDFPEMQRGLPLEITSDPDVMLVWEMNGEPLPAPHGGPVRLLVPGWGGIASTKWIVGLDLIDRPFDGHYNSESYVFIDEDGTVVRPVTQQPVKSVITSPLADESLTAGPVTISGFAWSGYGGIERVEVSTDGGGEWADAEIVEEAGPISWVRFEFPWDAAAGDAVLLSRATDQRGLQQPMDVNWNAKGYHMNAVFPVEVSVD
jgi:DMSO/TMAO reductase YedYZ molybdopterin-dependent catalytic subunit